MGTQDVKAGDCAYSLADAAGLRWDAVWNNPANAGLKEKSKHPGVIATGEQVLVPEIALRNETGETEMRHRFRLTGFRCRLRLRLLLDNTPRANLAYDLVVGGATQSGKTDDDGLLVETIPTQETAATLRLKTDDGPEEYAVAIGALDPTPAITGLQQRFVNLGFDCGTLDGAVGPMTERAGFDFASVYDYAQSDVAGVPFQGQIGDQHGC